MMTDLLVHALLWGLLVSAFLTVAFIALSWIDPEMWLNDYPPDIREEFGPMSPAANRKRWLLGLPVLVLALALVVLATVRFVRMSGGAPGFGPAFLHTFIVMMVFNVVDLILIDWLLFVRIQPRFVVLPGTEGLPGYQDYAFHWHAFLKGTVGITVLSAVFGGVAWAVG